MTLKVKFQKHGQKQYHDVSNSGIIFSVEFMDRLMDAVKEKKNYTADIAGIHEIETSDGKVDHAPFFVIHLDSKSSAFEFLFKILPGEESQLIGVKPKVEEARLKTLVEQTLKKSRPL